MPERTKVVFDAVFKPNTSYSKEQVLQALKKDGSPSFTLGELFIAQSVIVAVRFEIATNIKNWQSLSQLNCLGCSCHKLTKLYLGPTSAVFLADFIPNC